MIPQSLVFVCRVARTVASRRLAMSDDDAAKDVGDVGDAAGAVADVDDAAAGAGDTEEDCYTQEEVHAAFTNLEAARAEVEELKKTCALQKGTNAKLTKWIEQFKAADKVQKVSVARPVSCVVLLRGLSLHVSVARPVIHVVWCCADAKHVVVLHLCCTGSFGCDGERLADAATRYEEAAGGRCHRFRSQSRRGSSRFCSQCQRQNPSQGRHQLQAAEEG
jgi:hypothetical protein